MILAKSCWTAKWFVWTSCWCHSKLGISRSVMQKMSRPGINKWPKLKLKLICKRLYKKRLQTLSSFWRNTATSLFWNWNFFWFFCLFEMKFKNSCKFSYSLTSQDFSSFFPSTVSVLKLQICTMFVPKFYVFY